MLKAEQRRRELQAASGDWKRPPPTPSFEALRGAAPATGAARQPDIGAWRGQPPAPLQSPAQGQAAAHRPLQTPSVDGARPQLAAGGVAAWRAGQAGQPTPEMSAAAGYAQGVSDRINDIYRGVGGSGVAQNVAGRLSGWRGNSDTPSAGRREMTDDGVPVDSLWTSAGGGRAYGQSYGMPTPGGHGYDDHDEPPALHPRHERFEQILDAVNRSGAIGGGRQFDKGLPDHTPILMSTDDYLNKIKAQQEELAARYGVAQPSQAQVQVQGQSRAEHPSGRSWHERMAERNARRNGGVDISH